MEDFSANNSNECQMVNSKFQNEVLNFFPPLPPFLCVSKVLGLSFGKKMSQLFLLGIQIAL